MVVYCLLVTAGFLNKQVESLREEIVRELKPLGDRCGDEWDSPDDSTSFGLRVWRLLEGDFREIWEPEAASVILSLRRMIIRLGAGSRGLRQLRGAMRLADARAEEITPDNCEWDQDDLDVEECDGVFELYALNSDAVSRVVDEWIEGVLACLQALFDLLESGSAHEWPTLRLILEFLYGLDRGPENLAAGDPIPEPPPPLQQIHEDVLRSVTPTNGPNAAVRAIESSIRVRGAQLAA